MIDVEGPKSEHSIWAISMLIAAILIRSGSVPVHCWMTDLFENATFATALLYVTPMAGAYAAVRLVLPISPDWALQSIAIISLITAVYAAGMALVALAYQVVVRAYFMARLQNLFWSSTGNRHIRFGSRLRARSLAAVMGRNWALMIVTLGLYFPFAAVAQARVRLQAVVLHTKIDLDALVALRGGGQDDAAGDAAADVLGFDIGL